MGSQSEDIDALLFLDALYPKYGNLEAFNRLDAIDLYTEIEETLINTVGFDETKILWNKIMSCNNCSKVEIIAESFRYITINLFDNVNIQECISQIFLKQKIEEYICTKCNSNSADQKLEIIKNPRILCFDRVDEKEIYDLEFENVIAAENEDKYKLKSFMCVSEDKNNKLYVPFVIEDEKVFLYNKYEVDKRFL